MKTFISHVLNHTHALGVFEFVSLETSQTSTYVKATNESKTVILNAESHAPVDGMEIGTYGISNMGYLASLVNMYNGETDSLTVTKKASEDTLEELVFKSTDGRESTYRLAHKSRIPPINVFTGDDKIWDVIIDADAEQIERFNQMASVYGSMEEYFLVSKTGDDLVFNFGDAVAATHKAKMVFAAGVEGKFDTTLAWKTSDFQAILKLAKTNGDVKIKFTSRGVLSVVVPTAVADFKYFIKAKAV